MRFVPSSDLGPKPLAHRLLHLCSLIRICLDLDFPGHPWAPSFPLGNGTATAGQKGGGVGGGGGSLQVSFQEETQHNHPRQQGGARTEGFANGVAWHSKLLEFQEWQNFPSLPPGRNDHPPFPPLRVGR